MDPSPVLVFGDQSKTRVRAEIDERWVYLLKKGQHAEIYGRGLGPGRFQGKTVLIKSIMGKKTVFSRESSERKDLDVLQVLIETESPLSAPVGLQVDVDIHVDSITPK
jgi:hypothetical protein